MTKKKMNLPKKRFEDFSNFQPRQIEALKALQRCKYLLYGGAAFGGKSYFLRWIAVWLLLYYYQVFGYAVTVGLFCEDYPSLHDRQLSKIRYEFPQWLGKMNNQLHEFKLDKIYGGGTIAFRNLDDPSKYLSAEFAAVLIDELTRNKREVFDFLTGMRMRWPGVSECKFIGATNPGSIGHLWVKKLWVDRDFGGERLDPDDFSFVPAYYSDNKYLDPSYEKQLNSLPDKLREAYKHGNWDIFEGQFFTEFNRDVHVVEPFKIPDEWKRKVGIDYGTANPFCALWGAADWDDNVYIYKEAYQRGLNATEQAMLIKAMNSEDGKVSEYAADPSMWAKTQTVSDKQKGYTLKAIKDYYQDEKLWLTPSNNDRVSGANLVREYLYWEGEPGAVIVQPKLKIFSTCANLIRTLPALVHDEKKPEDVDTDGEDHAYDALRYFLHRIKRPAPIEEAEPAHPQFEGFDIDEKGDPREWWK